ncbi:MAG: NAD(+)/NADH kinase [Planctomycetota bacterium]
MQTRVHLLANPDKKDARSAFDDLRAFAVKRCVLVGADFSVDGRSAVQSAAQRIVILGGDGTLIGVARSLGRDQIPLIGVNVGKLGYLAEFSVDELQRCFEQVLTDDSLVSRRTILEVAVRSGAGENRTSLAVNDCVIQAGPPFRMIRLDIDINHERLTTVAGDGLIVCTPTGSTAHNLSAGGPIVQPDVDAIILTPLNPHSLTHRPLAIDRQAMIEITAAAANPGTTVILDGQLSFPFAKGDQVSIRRFEHDFLAVRNPLYSRWHNLVGKLHWGRSPSSS